MEEVKDDNIIEDKVSSEELQKIVRPGKTRFNFGELKYHFSQKMNHSLLHTYKKLTKFRKQYLKGYVK